MEDETKDIETTETTQDEPEQVQETTVENGENEHEEAETTVEVTEPEHEVEPESEPEHDQEKEERKFTQAEVDKIVNKAIAKKLPLRITKFIDENGADEKTETALLFNADELSIQKAITTNPDKPEYIIFDTQNSKIATEKKSPNVFII